MTGDYLPFKSAESTMRELGYPNMTPLQRTAFSHLVYKQGAREFIMGGTSSGKTLIPLVAYKADSSYSNKLLYLVPYRALANQKKRDFEKLFGKNTEIIVSTAEYSSADEAVLYADCDIAIVIYEKIFIMLSKYDNRLFEKYRYLVFDEPGIINGPERGLKADYLLRTACNAKATNVYVLGTPYFDWSNYIQRYQFNSIKETSRPIKLELEEKYYINKEEDLPDIAEIVDICEYHRRKQHKILIFVNNRDKCRKMAHNIYSYMLEKKLIEKPSNITQKKDTIIRRLGLSKKDLYGFMDAQGDIDFLAYASGIGYHNASIPEELRQMVEDDFLRDDGGLHIVVSTETLAYGLNSNIDVVIIADLYKKISGNKQMLTVNEYENYRGRAGRLGKTKKGYAYVFINMATQYEEWEQLKTKLASPDAVRSNFLQSNVNQEHKVFACLNFFTQASGLTRDKLINIMMSFPGDVPGGKKWVEQEADEVISQLLQRKLICSSYDAWEETEKYVLSTKGQFLIGIIISPDTYDKLTTIPIPKDGCAMTLDLFYALCDCIELTDRVTDYLQWDFALRFHKQLPHFLKKAQSNRDISDGCMQRILSDKSLERYKSENFQNSMGKQELKKEFRPDKKTAKTERETIRRLRMMQALYMWIYSTSVTDIAKACNFSYSTIKGLGEKANYITEALVATKASIIPPSMEEGNGDFSKNLRALRLSMFYGIHPEILRRCEVLGITTDNIEPHQGRELRILGRMLTLQSERKTKDSDYKSLEKLFKNIRPVYRALLD